MIIARKVVADAGYATLINIKWTIICSYRIDSSNDWSEPDIKKEAKIFEDIAETITFYTLLAKALIYVIFVVDVIVGRILGPKIVAWSI